ncbi:hypothetical protein [Enterococcus sp. AZ072]|uniref:hypothetical protein n=1 Tax=unclassified Enterococcus TaxID=2608891 RepID=UPI003D293E5B
MNLHNLLTTESLFSNLIVFIVAVLLTNWWHKRKSKPEKAVSKPTAKVSFEPPSTILKTYRDDTKRFGFAYLEKHTPAIIEKLTKNRADPSSGIDQAAIDEVINSLKNFQKQFKQVGKDANEQEKRKIMVLNYVNKTLIRWKQLSEQDYE